MFSVVLILQWLLWNWDHFTKHYAKHKGEKKTDSQNKSYVVYTVDILSELSVKLAGTSCINYLVLKMYAFKVNYKTVDWPNLNRKIKT